MKTGISKKDEMSYMKVASEMLAENVELKKTPDGFFCVLDKSPSFFEREKDTGRIFYSFSFDGKIFHISFD